MAITKVSRGLLSTGIVDNSNATAITLNADESATFASSVTANPSGGVVTLGTSGHLTSKQSLDVATAGGRFIGSSNRGVLGQIRIEQTANSTDGGYIAFDTSPSGSTSPTVRLRIDSAGNITQTGSNSADFLIKAPTDNASLTLQAGSSDTGAEGAFVNFLQNTTYKWQMGMNTDNSFRWYNYATSSEAMRITSAGNVGIGVVPSAAYKMQVNVATNTVSTGSPAASSLFNIAGGTTTVGNGVSLQLSNNSGAKETAWRISAVTTSGNNGDLVFNGYAGGADYPERFRIASNGNAIITAPAFHPLTINRGQDIAGHISLEVSGATKAFYGANSSALLRVANSNFTQKMLVDHSGNLTTAGSVNSDRDLKENIADIPNGSLALIKQLQPRTFNFLESFGFGTKSRTGFIAQEVANVFTTDNRVVTGTDGESNMGVDPLGIIAHLTKAVQEQQATIEAQATAITDLTTRLTALENN